MPTAVAVTERAAAVVHQHHKAGEAEQPDDVAGQLPHNEGGRVAAPLVVHHCPDGPGAKHRLTAAAGPGLLEQRAQQAAVPRAAGILQRHHACHELERRTPPAGRALLPLSQLAPPPGLPVLSQGYAVRRHGDPLPPLQGRQARAVLHLQLAQRLQGELRQPALHLVGKLLGQPRHRHSVLRGGWPALALAIGQQRGGTSGGHRRGVLR
mmetsp:Transcript_5365/g.13899  ORF Transcript_5365/g.13899 Transcript_5365/m.13899 type:complete len:209 (+) Transcript_5365:1170-1796(+)